MRTYSQDYLTLIKIHQANAKGKKNHQNDRKVTNLNPNFFMRIGMLIYRLRIRRRMVEYTGR